MTHWHTILRARSHGQATGKLLLVIGAGLLALGLAIAQADRHLQADLLQQVKLFSQALNAAQVAQLTGQERPTLAADATGVEKQLQAFRELDGAFRSIYLMRQQPDGSFLRLAHNEAPDSFAYNAPEQMQTTQANWLRQAFAENEGRVIGPIDHRWGSCVTVLMPVNDDRQGITRAMLGLTIDTATWHWRVAANSTLAVALILTASFLLATLIIAANGGASASIKPLQRRLLLPLAAMVALLVAGFAALLLNQQRAHLRETGRAVVAEATHDLMRVIAEQSRSLAALQEGIVRDAGQRAALQAGDRAKLLELAQPIYEQLNKSYGVTHYYMIDAQGVCLIRAHQPERFGDRIERHTLQEARRSAATAWGLELGVLGTLTLRVVRPVFEGKQVIGYFELGRELQDIVNELPRRAGTDYAILLDKRYLQRANWENRTRQMGRIPDWDRYRNQVLIYSTRTALPYEITQVVNTRPDPNDGDEVVVRIENNQWGVVRTPLRDSANTAVGELLVSLDLSALVEQNRQLIQMALSGALALLAALFGFLFVLLRRTDAGIRGQQARLLESEKRFDELARQNRTFVWEVDHEGVYTYASDMVEQVLGYRPEDLVGRLHFYDLHPEMGREAFRETLFQTSRAQGTIAGQEHLACAADGHLVWLSSSGIPLLDGKGNLRGYHGSSTDISERKGMEEAIERRMLALTRPLNDAGAIAFEELFNLDSIQRLQDQFAAATGVASLIVRPDGTAITKPSNFCRLCDEIVRGSKLGKANCLLSDVRIGRFDPHGPIIQPCESCGLWDAGAGISVGGRHIASWLVGQVRDATQNEAAVRAYALEIGADPEEAAQAFHHVPAMTRERFESIAQALFTLSKQLSSIAYQNLQQARFITERRQSEAALKRRDTLLEAAARAGQRLLLEHDLGLALEAVMQLLGEASQQDRAYLFEVESTEATDAVIVSMRNEWVREGVSAEIDNPDMQHLNLSEATPLFAKVLSCGQRICTLTRNLPAAEQAVLLPQRIVSILLVPVFVGETFWGFIGFENCREEYSWEAGEEAALATVAASIGGAVARKRVENELIERNQFITTLLRAMPVAVYYKDRAGRYLGCNDAFTELMGYTSEELRGKTVYEVWPSELSETYHRKDLDLLEDRQHQAFQFKVRDKHGELRPAILAKDVYLDVHGEVAGLVGAVLDITELKRAETALLESEERLRLALMAARQGLYDLNLQTGEAVVNAEYATMLDFDPADFQETTAAWIERLHPDDRETTSRIFHDYVAGKRPDYRVEYRLRTRLGDWKSILSVGRIVEWDALGRPLRMLGTHTDLTEQRRLEQDYQTLFRQMHDGFVVYEAIYDDAGKPVDCRVLNGNPSAERMTGIKLREMLDKTMLEVLPDTEPYWIEMIGRVAQTGEGVSYEHVFGHFGRCFKGTAFSPEPGKCVCIFSDVTERKQAEEEREMLHAQLVQAQKMESVGRLAGGVAHDFNNMLSVILGHAEMAMDKLEPHDPLYNDLNEISKAAERSAELTRQLLAFARRQTVMPKVLDLNETIEGMLRMLRRLIGEAIELSWLPGSPLWSIKVDPSQIDQVLANLCVNARDAIGQVGRISIETGNITFDKEYCDAHPMCQPGEYVLLTVSDTGCGMDSKTMERIFEPFFTTKELGQGTGLGLSMVYGIVKQNDGFINVYSEPGIGTTFRVYFPRHLSHEERERTTAVAEPIRTGEETILLVEDEPSILDIAKAMLERQGYKVLAASTPGAAMALAREHAGAIDLLITDVIMPEMNGRDLANNLLSLYPNIKRLFMSGYTADVIANSGVLEEGVNFLQKPFNRKNMVAKVREVLDQE